MRRRSQPLDIPPRIAEQIECAQEHRQIAHAMRMRCTEDRDLLRERMKHVRETSRENRLAHHELRAN